MAPFTILCASLRKAGSSCSVEISSIIASPSEFHRLSGLEILRLGAMLSRPIPWSKIYPTTLLPPRKHATQPSVRPHHDQEDATFIRLDDARDHDVPRFSLPPNR